jgi:OCT family organic cation transporter-like MFS transporter 15
VLLITQLVHCCVFFSAISVPSFTWIYGISWVAGIAMAGLLVADVIILSEAVDSQYRNWYSGISFCGWGIGAACIAYFASQTDSWRTIALTAGLVSLCVIPLLLWLDESLPYLVAMSGDKAKVAAVLKRIAYYNGRPFDPAIGDKVVVEEEPDVSVKALFQESWIVERFFRMAGVWVAAVVGYYGILFCLPTYIGNIYTNGIVLGFSEVPANMATAFSLNSLGRRSTTQLLLSVGGIACITAHIAAVINSVELQTGALFLARFMMTALYLLIYVYTSELFPTSLRSLAMGMCTAVGNLGGLLAPNLVLLSQVIGVAPLVIISIILFLCCWVGWGLPETKGLELSEVGKEEKQPSFDYTPLTSD